MRALSTNNLLNIRHIIDEAKCYKSVRDLRWPDGIVCPYCDAKAVIKHGKDDVEPNRQKYRCKACFRYFDDLTNTVFKGHHQPLSVWILCLYFMELNISNHQIAQELDLNKDDVHQWTMRVGDGDGVRQPKVKLEGEVEFDEAYVVAGHKGNSKAVKEKGREGRRNRLKGARGRGTLEKEKPPIFGMMERGGEVIIQMLENVRQKTIAPIIQSTMSPPFLLKIDVLCVAKMSFYHSVTIPVEMRITLLS